MAPRTAKPERGIWKRKANVHDPDVKVLDFSYESTVMAQLVVDAWANAGLKTTLLDHTHQAAVRTELENRGIFLSHPVVLTEDEYNAGWQQDHDDEVVLVLPNDGRKTAASGGFTLLETAKLLMAVTPNGI
jgi:uncharacterized protein with GYD domain